MKNDSLFGVPALRGEKEDANKENLIILFIHFCCLCPLDLDIKLSFNISKGAYFVAICSR